MKGTIIIMTKEEMTKAVGPCSIMCYTCFGYVDGGIRKHAACLHELYKGGLTVITM